MSEVYSDIIVSIIMIALNNSQLILALLLVVCFAASFLGRNVVLSRKLVLLSLGILALSLLAEVAVNIFSIDSSDSELVVLLNSILSLLIYIYAFVFFLLAFKERRFLRAVEAIICYVLLVTYISYFSSMTVVYFCGGTDEIILSVLYENIGYTKEWVAIVIIQFLITFAMFAIVYFRFYKPKRCCVISIPYRVFLVAWSIIFQIVITIPVILSSTDYSMEQRYGVISKLYSADIVMLGLAMPVIVIIITAERVFKEKNKSQEIYLEAQLDYIEQYKKKQVETNAFRHDIKNNLALAQMMLEDGQTDEAKAYISDMLGNVRALSPEFVTGDEMLDLIVSMKAEKMKERNIRFTLDGVADGGLNIKPMDMCSIFANAIDNAIEAASKCEDPFLSLEIKRTDKFFVIKITNSAVGTVDVDRLMSSSGYTSKSDKEHHGFGLMNARYAVENNNGVLKVKADNNSFTLSVMLPRN